MEEEWKSSVKFLVVWNNPGRYRFFMSFPLAELTSATEKKPSLVDDAYAALKEAIRDGVLPPGYHGSEQEIANKLNMSRTPVHEAIIRLQSEGLVKVLSKRGVQVCPISPQDMREIFDVIIALESMAAELMAGLPESVRKLRADALEALNTKMAAALRKDDLSAWADADDKFHRSLVSDCGNARIAQIAATILDQSHRARLRSLKLRPLPTKSVKEHQLIIDAIRKGSVLEAHTRARVHRVQARDTLLPLLDRFGVSQL